MPFRISEFRITLPMVPANLTSDIRSHSTHVWPPPLHVPHRQSSSPNSSVLEHHGFIKLRPDIAGSSRQFGRAELASTHPLEPLTLLFE